MKIKSALVVFPLLFPVSIFASGGGGHGGGQDAGHAPAADSHVVTAAPEVHAAPHWAYSGSEGPNRWGELAAEFGTCKFGRNQSPINISPETDSPLFDLEFHYSAVPLQILNNGHTIQFNYGMP
ncbi:carbonic anhydrase family protein, partial [Pseudomonadota bacterium]